MALPLGLTPAGGGLGAAQPWGRSEALHPAQAEQDIPPRRRLEITLVGFVDDDAAGDAAVGDAAVGQVVDARQRFEPAGAERIRAFMAERANEGFASLGEAADLVAGWRVARTAGTLRLEPR